jgi:hypothetical protein
MAWKLMPDQTIYVWQFRLDSLLYPSTQTELVAYFPASSQLKHLPMLMQVYDLLIFSNCGNFMQAYVDAVLDLASHFITRLRRYASFCRTLASHAVTAGAGSNRNTVTSPTQSSASPTPNQG